MAGQVSHIKDVAQWIPDMDAVLNIHDTPLSFVSAAHKAELEELVEDGECESRVLLPRLAVLRRGPIQAGGVLSISV